ncbi:hypothetical protein P8452_65147 [Trifolium repens]|nr:hypothetical protein P8452_65147 [Trifolium repens]
MLLEDLSYAIEGLEAARPPFKVIDALEATNELLILLTTLSLYLLCKHALNLGAVGRRCPLTPPSWTHNGVICYLACKYKFLLAVSLDFLRLAALVLLFTLKSSMKISPLRKGVV